MNDNLFFDFSKLKPNGFHFVAVGFSLPYSLHLPIDSYDIDVEINLENQLGILSVQILIEDQWKNQKEGHQKFPFAAKDELVEKSRDKHATYRYTRVWVFIPVFSDNPNKPKDINSIWEQVNRTRVWYRDLSIRSVNRFLEIYRFHSQEFHIKPLAGQELWFDFIFALLFNDTPQSLSTNFATKIMPIYYWGDIYPQLYNIPDKIVSNIQAQLKSPHEVPLSENLLLNAYDYFDQGNYRLAIIEAETAFEAAILHHLHNYYSENSPEIKKIERINSFTVLMNHPYCQDALKHKDFHKNQPRYQLWDESVWKIRGKLIHGHHISLTAKEAETALKLIEELLEYLIGRVPTL